MENSKRGSNIMMITLAIILVLLICLITVKATGLLESGEPAEKEDEITDTIQNNGDKDSLSNDDNSFPGISDNDTVQAGDPEDVDLSQMAGPFVGESGTPEVDEPVKTGSDYVPYQFDESELVPYEGVVEELFFHPVIAYPELAFDGDYQSDGFDDWMVTAEEYEKILQGLYDNGYILVDINELYSETVNENGVTVMKRNTLMIPEGRKPIVLTYDDVNYYDYMRENGIIYKLILDDNGNIAGWGYDPDGNEVISYDLDIVTILDAFVAEHPDFSLNGAKGCLGLTGYEGILGYRTQLDSPNREEEIEAVKPVIERLKETGWTFVSHSYSHLNMTNASYERIVEDTDKWMAEVGSLVGDTMVLLYPYGARVDENNGAAFQYLQQNGFRVFLSVGVESYINIHTDSPAVCGDRMHSDGTTLRWDRKNYLKFYDAREVMDTVSRPDRGYDWDEE